MTNPMVWLIFVALFALALFVVAGVLDERAHRGPRTRVPQSLTARPLPWRIDMVRARAARLASRIPRRPGA